MVAFSWRHWDWHEGKYNDHPPTNARVDFFGTTVAKVSDKLVIEELNFYFDPADCLLPLMKGGGGCPFSGRLAGKSASSSA